MSLLRRPRPGALRRAVRFARMAGTSTAAPDAAPWVTDFLNAAYYARGRDERAVDDLRLAFCILTTRWHRAGRRLHLTDLPAFHAAFGRARLVRRGGVGRLTRDDLLAGAEELLGPGFSDGYGDAGRRGWGIVFRDAAERAAYRPESRLTSGALGALTPPGGDPAALGWATYRPVPVTDVDLVAGRLLAPDTWPDHGSDHGRFTAVRSGGLPGQTFEIEVVAAARTRRPVITRGYVTATRVAGPDEPGARRELVAEMDAGLGARGGPSVPEGQEAVMVAELTTHDGHFMGPARSHLVLSSGPSGAALRDVGAWDPLTFPQSTAYRWGGRAAQHAFWGEAEPESSMLHQFAAP